MIVGAFDFLKKKWFLALVLFAVTFSIFAFAISEIWFQLDDLGVIGNGIIKDWKSFLRVFSDDERNYIYPINFNVPKANIISGFYRPLQHIIFSLIYYFQEFNAYAYYFTNVFFHALNVVLFFYLFSFWMPLSLSFLGGVLFAFYPVMGWITWVSTLHNFLATIFLLLCVIFYQRYLFGRGSGFAIRVSYYLSGLMFLLSIISRENTIVLGMWIIFSVFLLFTSVNVSFWEKIKQTFSNTWIFIVVYFLYFLLRLNAFGVASLGRTYNNLLLKFPVLTKLFVTGTGNGAVVQRTIANYAQKATKALLSINDFSSPEQISWLSKVVIKFKSLTRSFWTWMNIFFNTNVQNVITMLVVLFFIGFIFFSYRSNKKIFLCLLTGIVLFSWPGIVAYPNPRYLNAVFPFLIFTYLLAIYFYNKEAKSSFIKLGVLSFVFILTGASIYNGAVNNISAVKNSAKETLAYKQKFTKFFEENSFGKDVNFILVGIPFVSDIQNVFQAFLHNLDLKVAHVRASTIAQEGIMGCHGNYKIKGVKNKIEKLKEDGKLRLRFISLDEDHSALWNKFSHLPLKWSSEENAYIWTHKEPDVGQWSDFSMGKFVINKRLGNNHILDATFVFDDKWIDENTVFVTWDTMVGKYKVL